MRGQVVQYAVAFRRCSRDLECLLLSSSALLSLETAVVLRDGRTEHLDHTTSHSWLQLSSVSSDLDFSIRTDYGRG